MAILTGNHGRMYIGRKADASRGNGLLLGSTITQTIVNPGKIGYWTGLSYPVRTVTGQGEGARVNPTADLPEGSQTGSSSVTFQVTSPGWGYRAGDLVYIGWWGSLIRGTNNFSISTLQTVGIENESDLLQDAYRIAKIRSWSLSSESEMIETTSLGDQSKTYVPGINSATGSATVLFYEDQLGTEQMLDTYELMEILFPTGEAPLVTMSLAVDGRQTYDLSLSGGAGSFKTNFVVDAFITSASLSATYGEVVAIDVNFTVQGALRDRPWKPNVVSV